MKDFDGIELIGKLFPGKDTGDKPAHLLDEF